MDIPKLLREEDPDDDDRLLAAVALCSLRQSSATAMRVSSSTYDRLGSQGTSSSPSTNTLSQLRPRQAISQKSLFDSILRPSPPSAPRTMIKAPQEDHAYAGEDPEVLAAAQILVMISQDSNWEGTNPQHKRSASLAGVSGQSTISSIHSPKSPVRDYGCFAKAGRLDRKSHPQDTPFKVELNQPQRESTSIQPSSNQLNLFDQSSQDQKK